MGDLSQRCSSFSLSRFSPLLGFMPPATLLSRLIKRNLAPFSELFAVDPSSSGVPGLARGGPVACAAKDTVACSTAGVVLTLARQSPTLANNQLLLLQQLLPPQLQPPQLLPLQLLLQQLPPQQLPKPQLLKPQLLKPQPLLKKPQLLLKQQLLLKLQLLQKPQL